MPNDPALAADTCIYVEANTGDGGAHNGGGVWWLSPDIALTGPTSGPDKADPGQHNSVQVTFHRKAANSGCMFPGDESLVVQLWVGNPSLVMTPSNPSSTKMVGLMGSPLPAEGSSGTQMFDWVPPTGLPASDPQSPGHKCLIVRCFPSSLVASTTSFFAPDDQHVAQRNICIVPCGNPGAAQRPGPCGFTITTVNPNQKKAETVAVRAVADLRPTKFVREVVLSRLRHLAGFKRLATKPPAGFQLKFARLRASGVADRTRGKGKLPPSYEARVKLGAGRLIRFEFIADLSNAKLGDAHVFHLTQRGPGGQVQGGLTLVMVAV